MSVERETIIDLFPRAEEIPESMTRQVALGSVWRVLEASRAAIDEITSRTTGLSVEERFATDSIAEQLHMRALDFFNKLD